MLLLVTACGGARSTAFGDGYASATNRSATVSWTNPTNYVDNTPFPPSEIAGFHIYVGKSEDNMVLHKVVTDSNTTSARINNLDDGVLYVAVSCYNIGSIESDLSTIAVLN